MERKKPKRKRKMRRLMLSVLLLVALLLLLGDRLGLGTGELFSLFSTGPGTETQSPVGETPEAETVAAKELVVQILNTSLMVEGETLTLEDLAELVEAADKDLLIVLKDTEANYALFVEVESLLKEKGQPYIVETP